MSEERAVRRVQVRRDPRADEHRDRRQTARSLIVHDEHDGRATGCRVARLRRLARGRIVPQLQPHRVDKRRLAGRARIRRNRRERDRDRPNAGNERRSKHGVEVVVAAGLYGRMPFFRLRREDEIDELRRAQSRHAPTHALSRRIQRCEQCTGTRRRWIERLPAHVAGADDHDLPISTDDVQVPRPAAHR
jgi:hypothetical protein